MKALLFHAEEYGAKFHSFSNRPKGIFCEEVGDKENQFCKNCVVVFITVEKGDSKAKVSRGIVKEIKKMCGEVKRDKVVVLPFAHLSNNLCEPKRGFEILQGIEAALKKSGLKVVRTHFGSNKSLHLDVYGHAGNVRYREF